MTQDSRAGDAAVTWTASDFIANVRGLTGGEANAGSSDEAHWGDITLCRFSSLPRESVTRPLDAHFFAHHLGHPVDLAWRLGGGALRKGRCYPGTSSVVPAGHEVYWETPGDMRVINIFIPRRLLSNAEEAVFGGQSGAGQDERIGFEDRRAERLALLMADALVPSGPGDPLFAQSLTAALCVQLVSSGAGARAAATLDRSGRLTPRQVARAVECMHARLAAPITLLEIAAAVGISEFHFARGFRRATGKTPHRFLTELRVAKAKELLAQDALSLSAIALECGFGSASRFSTVFSQYAGLTPGRYRQATAR